MSMFRCALGSLCTIVYIPMFMFIISFFFSPIEPVYNIRFDVANSAVTDFNYTETTRIDGTNNLHYKYNLSLDVTVRRPDKNYDFKNYDDVQVMAFYKNKRFAVVDLSSFYREKNLTNTTDLLPLKHSLIGEYVDVLAIDPPPEDYAQNISDGEGGTSAITDDHMVAQLHYSISPPRNIEWSYKTIFSKEELEYKCDLEIIFPSGVGQFSQHTNASKTIWCRGNILVYSWKYYVYFVLAGLLFLVIWLSVVVFIGYLMSDLHLDHKIHDCVTVKIQG